MTTDSQPTPEQVVAEHRYRPQDHSTIEGYAYCWCGWATPVVLTHTDALALHAAHVLAALRDAGYAVVKPGACGKWLTPGTAHYEHLHTKCVLAGWAAYRQHAGSEVVRSDAVVQATLDTVRDIFADAERGES